MKLLTKPLKTASFVLWAGLARLRSVTKEHLQMHLM